MDSPEAFAAHTQVASFFFHLILGAGGAGGLSYIIVRMITMDRVNVRRMTPKQREEHEKSIDDLKIY